MGLKTLKLLMKTASKRAPYVTPKLEINAKNLGVILKDGSISFQTQDAAIGYGIKRCQESLLSKNQFERAVFIKGRRVVSEIQGTRNEVPLSNATEIMLHSHPDTYAKGCTTALSAGDYQYFIEHKCAKKIYAVNSNGEVYKMEKLPEFDFDKVDITATMGDFGTKYNRSIFGGENAPIEQRELLEKCLSTKDEDLFYDEFWPKFSKPLTQSMDNVPKYIVDGTHSFWANFAQLFGVKVETNFSNFVHAQ